jgi:hypothetical protein
VDGRLVEAGPIAYRGFFGRASAEPRTTSDSFDTTDLTQKYRLIVVNGGLRGPTHRTSSAQVALNGAVVVPPSSFNQLQAAITVPVALQTENQITARLAGEPGSQIAVVIVPVP